MKPSLLILGLGAAWTSACVEIPSTSPNTPAPTWFVVHEQERMPVRRIAPGATIRVLIIDRSGAINPRLAVSSADATLTLKRDGEALELSASANPGQTTLNLGPDQRWPIFVEEPTRFELLWPGRLAPGGQELPDALDWLGDQAWGLALGTAADGSQIWGGLDPSEVEVVGLNPVSPLQAQLKGPRLVFDLSNQPPDALDRALLSFKGTLYGNVALRKRTQMIDNTTLEVQLDDEGAWIMPTSNGVGYYGGALQEVSVQSDCARLVTSGPYLGRLPASADIARVQRVGDPRPGEPPCPFTVSVTVPGVQAPVTAQGMLPARVSAQR